MATDFMDQEIAEDDFVISFNSIYQVISVGKRGITAKLINPSATTKNKRMSGKDCLKLDRDAVLIWMLKRGYQR